MKKIFYALTVICMLMLGMAMPSAYADFPERPVGFVVLDYGRNVDTAFYKDIKAPVKWAYHFPYYKIVEDDAMTKNVAEAVAGKKNQITPELMNGLAEANKVDVLVLAQIYQTSEEIVPRMFDRYGPSTVIRVTCFADLYCYRKDNNKLLKKILRDRFVTDNNAYDKPQETVKWQLSKLVNTMEGRPIIGGDN